VYQDQVDAASLRPFLLELANAAIIQATANIYPEGELVNKSHWTWEELEDAVLLEVLEEKTASVVEIEVEAYLDQEIPECAYFVGERRLSPGEEPQEGEVVSHYRQFVGPNPG
jgi:hypothetical protein